MATVFYENTPAFEVVGSYYRHAPWERIHKGGQVSVTKSATFRGNFESLLSAIQTSRASEAVVVGHGIKQLGLIMPLASWTGVSAGAAMKRLLELVNSADATGKVTDKGKIDEAVSDWDVKAWNRNAIQTLVTRCLKIRSAPDIAKEIHIRGCEIGASTTHIERIKQLLKADVVTAPKDPMFYVEVRPTYPVQDPRNWSEPVTGRRFVYTKQAGPNVGPFALDCEYDGTTSHSEGAVTDRRDIRSWASYIHKNAQSRVSTRFPVAGLYPHGGNHYFLTSDPVYTDRIAHVN